jgi:hypothetical protein
MCGGENDVCGGDSPTSADVFVEETVLLVLMLILFVYGLSVVDG